MKALYILHDVQIVRVKYPNLCFIQNHGSQAREEYRGFIQLVDTQGGCGISPVTTGQASREDGTKRFLVGDYSVEQVW